MRIVLACLIAVTGLLAAGPDLATAQDAAYPSRPVKIMIAFPVGGLIDTVSRIVADKLSASLGQQFIIEARPGAGGTLATAAVARADPDGYTLMMINDNHSINPSVFKSIPYDSVKDFAPIGFVGYAPMVLTANSGLGVRTAKALAEAAQAKPGQLSYGSVGIGSASHLAGEMFTARAGIKMLHVPFRGGAPALNDLVAGHLNTMFLSAVIGLQHMNAGALSSAGHGGTHAARNPAAGADHGGGRLSGGGGVLVRPGGARRHPAGRHRQTGEGAGRGARAARTCAGASPRWARW